MDMDDEMIVPGNNRKMQKRRSANRALFGKAKKEAFIEALSCSCNVAAAAEETGVAVGTVYTHRRKDPHFRELWWQALEQAAAKLVALRLQRELERAERRGDAGLDVAMDGPPDARQIADLYKLIGLLKEHSRGLAGAPKSGTRPPECASIEETCKALAKRLKAFGAREAKKAGEGK